MTTNKPQQPRRIEYVPVDELQAADRNPKRHHADAIARSIARFGFADAPILDERTGRLVAGHGRLADVIARRDAGKDAPDGVVVDDDGTWRLPVQRGWASRSDEDAEGFLVAHNHTTVLGGWDNEELAGLLTDLQAADETLLDAVSFTQDDLDALTSDGNEEEEEETADKFLDEFPEYGSDLTTDYRCPSCGYEWSGKAHGGGPTGDIQ